MRSWKKQPERPEPLRTSSGLAMDPKRFCNLWFATACVWMFECNISMQCAPLWNILNIYDYKEWVGTSWPYMRSCNKQSERPKPLRVAVSWPCAFPLNLQFASMHMNVWASAICQCIARPFETFWIFTRNKWGPDDHLRSCKRQFELRMLLRKSNGLAMHPKRFLAICGLVQHAFECLSATC